MKKRGSTLVYIYNIQYIYTIYLYINNSGKSWWILLSFTYLETGMNAPCKDSAKCVRNQSSWNWWAATGLLCVWQSLEQSLIDDAADQWPASLCAWVHANGRHFEHTLWLSMYFLCRPICNEFYALHNVWHRES